MNLRVDWILDEDPALCYREGFRAYVKRVGRACENPYRAGSEAHRAFGAGWQFASFAIPGPAVASAAQRKRAKHAGNPINPQVPLPMQRPH